MAMLVAVAVVMLSFGGQALADEPPLHSAAPGHRRLVGVYHKTGSVLAFRGLSVSFA